MTPGARIQETIEILDRLKCSNQPSDRLVASWFRKRRYAGSKDRAFVKDRIYDVLRNYHRLVWWMKGDASPRALTLASCILSGIANWEDLLKWCDGLNYRPKALDPCEIKRLKALRFGRGYLSGQQPIAIRCNLPQWLYDEALEVFKLDTEAELSALNSVASVDIRVNTLKMPRGRAAELLDAAGIKVSKTKYAPNGLRLASPKSLEQLTLFQNGCIEVQDESSQLVSHLCSVQENMNILDFCAGAGGKSLALAAIMKNKGRIILCDIDENRLKRAKVRILRAGVSICSTKLLNNDQNYLELSSMGVFDRVLLDVPCTGSGVWRRHPEERFRLSKARYEDLILLQKTVLTKSSTLVKLGGHLIYATCSFLAKENEKQIENFLSESDNFSVIPVGEVWKSNLSSHFPGNNKYMRSTPYHHGSDGFFAAVLKRVK